MQNARKKILVGAFGVPILCAVQINDRPINALHHFSIQHAAHSVLCGSRYSRIENYPSDGIALFAWHNSFAVRVVVSIERRQPDYQGAVSSLKCNTGLQIHNFSGEHFERSFKCKTFSGPVIEFSGYGI